MKTEDSLGPVQLKDDEDDETKNSQNKEALEASNITIQDISNFWSEWDLNSGIPDFQVPGSHHLAHCLYGHSSWTQANNRRVLCKIGVSLVFLKGRLRKSRKMGWRNNLLLEERTYTDTPSPSFQWKKSSWLRCCWRDCGSIWDQNVGLHTEKTKLVGSRNKWGCSTLSMFQVCSFRRNIPGSPENNILNEMQG